MAPKKTQLKSLSRKGVNAKRAGSVKGGLKKEVAKADRLAANHNQVVRKLKTIPKKAISPKKAEAVKGGTRKEAPGGLSTRNHNQVLRTR